MCDRSNPLALNKVEDDFRRVHIRRLAAVLLLEHGLHAKTVALYKWALDDHQRQHISTLVRTRMLARRYAQFLCISISC